MKKIFSFLVIFLLSSYMTADLLAQGSADVYPVKFSDDLETVDYYIGFTRRQAMGIYWTLDHEVSSMVNSTVLRQVGEDDIQRWNFVLVGDEYPDQFYIQNKASGEFLSFHSAGARITDSYGKNVPSDAVSSEALSVYYADQDVEPHRFTLEWYAGGDAWVFYDETAGHVSLNDQSTGQNICQYGPDSGNSITFVEAGKPAVMVGSLSLSFGSLIDKNRVEYVKVSGRFLEDDITVSIEGDDAAFFTCDAPDNFEGGLLSIAFKPQEERDYSATLVLTSTTATTEVPLTGTVYDEETLPIISSEDDSNEHWYYIQFNYQAAANPVVWTGSGDNGQVRLKPIPAGPFDDNQLWKIVGDWENGYYLMNKANKGQLKYNQDDLGQPIVTENIEYSGSADQNGTDTYFLYSETGGYGDNFNLVKNTQGYWQFYNRDINSAPINASRTVDGFDGRYVYSRDGSDIRQASSSHPRTSLEFITPQAKIHSSATTTQVMKASAGETAELVINIVGIETTQDILIEFTGDDAFAISHESFTSAGGDLTVTFSPASDEEFYTANLKITSEGADDVVIPLTGSNGRPIISMEDDIWHVIAFNRNYPNANRGDYRVWQANGIGNETTNFITQVAPVEGSYAQQWKFSGTTDGLIIENRAGGFFTMRDAETGNLDGVLTDDEAKARLLAVVINGNEPDITYAFRDIVANNGLNDRGSNTICHYGTGDSGSQITFLPIELVKVGRKMIKAVASETFFKVTPGETATATVTLSTIGETGNITAAFEGEGFTASAVVDGEVTITFAPTEYNKEYKGVLTLSAPNADNAPTITFTGVTPPEFSTTDNEVWYYIVFDRAFFGQYGTDLVWQGNGIDEEISQVEYVKGQENQHWKLVSEYEDEIVIVNREGGEVAFINTDDNGDVTGNASLVDADWGGDVFAFVPGDTAWELWLWDYFMANDNSKGVLNDFGRSTVGTYSNDGGGILSFIEVDKIGGTGINQLTIDPNDQVIATRYYTIQGVEVKAPTTTGIYIVRTMYASGKAKAVKNVIIVR